LQAQIGRNAEERKRANEILNAGRDRELLKLMRDETMRLVLMVYARNQERQEAWKELYQDQEEGD
jgi:hypothetical protein